MKKLLLLTLAILVSLTLIGRPKGHLNPSEVDEAISEWVLESLREMGYTILPEVIIQDTLNRKGEKSNYEKYWEEKHGSLDKPKHDGKPEFDDLYYQPSKDSQKLKQKNKKDTLETKQVIVNNYYASDNFYYRDRFRPFFRPSFYFSYNYYTPWYYDDFYFGWNYPYFGTYYSWSYPYFGYNSYWAWNWYRPYYSPYYHNNYYNNHYSYNIGGTFQNKPDYGRRERPSNYTQNVPTPNRRVESTQPQRSRVETTQQRNPQTMKQYSESGRTYSPTYEKPRMSTRPQYNNTRISTPQNMENRRTNVDNPNRSVGTVPNSRREVVVPATRSYNPSPSREMSSPSRSFSEPSRNFNSGGSMDRRSSGSGVSNSGSSGRSSGSSSSSGTSNNSGGGGTGRR